MINLKLIETNFDEFNSKLKDKKVGEDVLKNLLEAYKEKNGFFNACKIYSDWKKNSKKK